jgi:hypothetical protein
MIKYTLISPVLIAGLAVLVAVATENTEVPSEFSDLYRLLENNLANYTKSLHERWNGSKTPLLFGTEFPPADNYANIYRLAKDNQLGGYYKEAVVAYLNGLQAVGVNSVKFILSFPMLYQPFYQSHLGDTSGRAYSNTVAFYQHLMNDLHSRGWKVIIQTQVQPAGNGALAGDPLNLAGYYRSLSFEDYAAGRAQNTLAIARLLKPDFLNFSPEPDTDGFKSLRPELDPRPVNREFAATVHKLQSAILNTLTSAKIPGMHESLKLVVGMGSWERRWKDVLENELRLPGIDIISIHVHPINTLYTNNLLANTLSIADAVRAAGKQAGMDEEWAYKQRDTEFGPNILEGRKVPDSDIETRDHWSFWAPIDQAFLQAMVDTAYYAHMVYFEASAPNQLFAYLDYYHTPGCEAAQARATSAAAVCNSSQWNKASNRAVFEALSSSPVSLSSTGRFYARLIRESPKR